MSVETWDEIRTAYQVARLGTVSGAAEVLGVHHATVIRHIDALEKRLGAKLFQRHARGYTPTEAGADLMLVAQITDDQFTQLAGRIRGRVGEVTGELIVTSVPEFCNWLTPVLVRFQQAHPGVVVRFLTDHRVFRLEYAEAHVAIRAGAAPDQPDNVVQPFLRQHYALYASTSYIEAHGCPTTDEELKEHRFVGIDTGGGRAPIFVWMNKAIPSDRITFRGSQMAVLQAAVLDGAGIGFFPLLQAAEHPDLVQVMPPRPEWSAQTWLVTHVDLHRTSKVQALLNALKEEAKSWPDMVQE